MNLLRAVGVSSILIYIYEMGALQKLSSWPAGGAVTIVVLFSCDLRAKVLQDGMRVCDEEGSLNRRMATCRSPRTLDTEGRAEREEPHCHVLSMRASHCLI